MVEDLWVCGQEWILVMAGSLDMETANQTWSDS